MVAVPEPIAITRPVVGTTVATDGSLLDHVTVLIEADIEASAGAMVAVSVSVFPAANDNMALFTVTPVTAT